MSCPSRFLNFKSFCGHADKCSESWKRMVCATIIYDCRTCSQLSKGLRELLVHYLRCTEKIMEEVTELGMSQSDIKAAIMQNINTIEDCQNKSSTRLMIKVTAWFFTGFSVRLLVSLVKYISTYIYLESILIQSHLKKNLQITLLSILTILQGLSFS